MSPRETWFSGPIDLGTYAARTRYITKSSIPQPSVLRQGLGKNTQVNRLGGGPFTLAKKAGVQHEAILTATNKGTPKQASRCGTLQLGIRQGKLDTAAPSRKKSWAGGNATEANNWSLWA